MAVTGYSASNWRTFNIGNALVLRKWTRLTGANTGVNNHTFASMINRYYWNDVSSGLVILDAGHPESYDGPNVEDGNGANYGGTIISVGTYGRCGWGGVNPGYHQNFSAGRFYCSGTQWNGCNYGNNYNGTHVFWTYCYQDTSFAGGRYAGTVYPCRWNVYAYNFSNYSYSGIGVACGSNGARSFEHGPDYLPAFASWNAYMGGWHMVAFRLNNSYHQLFVNGNLVSNGGYGYQGIPQVSSQQLWGGAYGYHEGWMGSYVVYERTLSDGEINNLFQWTRARYGV
jgi:hypothetical protein